MPVSCTFPDAVMSLPQIGDTVKQRANEPVHKERVAARGGEKWALVRPQRFMAPDFDSPSHQWQSLGKAGGKFCIEKESIL